MASSITLTTRRPEFPSLQISTLTWTDGWPHAALDGDAANEKR